MADFDVLAGATDGATLGSEWGLAGRTNGSSMNAVGSSSYYWSSTEYGTNGAYFIKFDTSGTNTDNAIKNYGFEVRCVQ
jgi:uncharacterized protein (TIGR02145 family)